MMRAVKVSCRGPHVPIRAVGGDVFGIPMMRLVSGHERRTRRASLAWVAADASLPLGWQISGLWRFDNLWVALSEGPAFDHYLSGSGLYADQPLRRLADRLQERRGLVTG
jgi:hypothetical protein